MRKLLFILAIAGIFAACSSANSQDAADSKAKTEMTEKKSDCGNDKADKEAKSDCDTKEAKSDCETKEAKKSDCGGDKTSKTEAKTGCGGKDKKSDCGGTSVAGNVPC